jgi:hypothetical protein
MNLNLLIPDDAKDLGSKIGANTTPSSLSHNKSTLKIKIESGLGQKILKGRNIATKKEHSAMTMPTN